MTQKMVHLTITTLTKASELFSKARVLCDCITKYTTTPQEEGREGDRKSDRLTQEQIYAWERIEIPHRKDEYKH